MAGGEAKNFYEDVYQRSAVKADMDVPPTGDHIAAKGLLGSTTRCPGSSGSSSPTTRGP